MGTKQILFMLIFLGACGTAKPIKANKRQIKPVKISIEQRRMNCVMRLMGNFKEFASMSEVRRTCNRIIPCPKCGQND